MLKRTNIFLDTENLKMLAKIGKTKGGLKVAQLIRLAVAEFVERETKKK